MPSSTVAEEFRLKTSRCAILKFVCSVCSDTRGGGALIQEAIVVLTVDGGGKI